MYPLVSALEKEMATHSSVLAWRIPGTGEPGGLPSMGCTESDTTEATWRQQFLCYSFLPKYACICSSLVAGFLLDMMKFKVQFCTVFY